MIRQPLGHGERGVTELNYLPRRDDAIKHWGGRDHLRVPLTSPESAPDAQHPRCDYIINICGSITNLVASVTCHSSPRWRRNAIPHLGEFECAKSGLLSSLCLSKIETGQMKATILNQVLETNKALCSAAWGPEHWDEALAKIQKVVGADHASFWIRTREGYLVNPIAMRVPQAAVEDFFGNRLEEDLESMLLIRRFLQLVPEHTSYDSVFIWDHFNCRINSDYQEMLRILHKHPVGVSHEFSNGINDTLYRKMFYYNEWARKYGMDYVLGVKVLLDAPYMAELALYRSKHCPVYEQAVKRILELISHNLKAASYMASITRELSALKRVSDRLSCGVILLDTRGEVKHCNKPALQIIADRADVRIAKRLIQLSNRTAAAQLGEFTRKLSSRTSCQEARVLTIGKKDTSITMILMPLNERIREGLCGPMYPAAILLFQSISEQIKLLRPILQNEYGCSKAESNVGAMYACGMKRNAVGRAIHVSDETVKSHLKSVFSKVEVGNKGELIFKLQSRLLASHGLGR